jgi:hypothetical protein
VIRRDQAPASPYFNGSGLPMPAWGDREASAMSLLIRLSTARSAVCQCCQEVRPWARSAGSDLMGTRDCVTKAPISDALMR